MRGGGGSWGCDAVVGFGGVGWGVGCGCWGMGSVVWEVRGMGRVVDAAG